MNTKQKSTLIGQIVQQLRISAQSHKDYSFDEGDTFFSLCFKTDSEIIKIAKIAGVL
ncbi:hypothetical protein LCGC14_2131920 [marine sediment metagenome]|uniref:Uncharacterized protein n=1 Tax=marine sediment metagenome TaxID=412755 RepID=A0A0F9E183_9ZZZZ